ncbi:hypothetical protein PROFUN_01953 [Planoprotostelium fungivorum]|uniref:Uncharacterized protein n=1 Tax=Planoprotostelium fungivorum TaxID=1890364 RepID=A0A2P6NB13_9EUKA|nr:hypothetical protein PROFUN_01953 [Planoprotostelium fungivorum]
MTNYDDERGTQSSAVKTNSVGQDIFSFQKVGGSPMMDQYKATTDHGRRTKIHRSTIFTTFVWHLVEIFEKRRSPPTVAKKVKWKRRRSSTHLVPGKVQKKPSNGQMRHVDPSNCKSALHYGGASSTEGSRAQRRAVTLESCSAKGAHFN